MSNGINSDIPPPARRELFAWAMYDFANSGYTTVVLTTVFNVYFVSVVVGAQADADSGWATFLWTLSIAISNALVLFTAPVLGAVADYRAIKKPLLLLTSCGCVLATALLAFVGRGDIVLAMSLVIIATLMFASGENLIAAFLPEICDRANMGRLSGYAWGLGYLGGIFSLGLCLAYIRWAESRGLSAEHTVPVTMVFVAVIFALAALPTFIYLRERAITQTNTAFQYQWIKTIRSNIKQSLLRVTRTVREATRFQDLFRFLLALAFYQSGVSAVIVLAAIYASEVIGLSQQQVIVLVLVVNVTAAIGAVLFGLLQDRFGSVRTLAMTLIIWIVAVFIVYQAEQVSDMWVAGNLIGLAMGSSQSAGRALVGQFTPITRTAEFFGLWGLASKFAAIIGPLSYGVINYLSAGNHRLALLSTLLFFIIGLSLLLTVNEQRGRQSSMGSDG